MTDYGKFVKPKLPHPRRPKGYKADVTDVRAAVGLPAIGGDPQQVLPLDAPPIAALKGLLSHHAGPGNNMQSFKPDSTPEDRAAWMHDMDINNSLLIKNPDKRKRAQALADLGYQRRQQKPGRSWKHWATSKFFNTGLQRVYYDSMYSSDQRPEKRARGAGYATNLRGKRSKPNIHDEL